ncbi:MAG TPA: tetratricopeptide repeat protein [Polyangiaceae bacterium]|nr:tetratricopeptide repeat protein [Polyangiaceae bacterium]
MTVIDFHPEELFDKLLSGGVSAAEQERLRAHLEACAVCRFEYAARLDFGAEARQIQTLRMPPLDLRPEAMRVLEPTRRRRSRAVVWGLAAAAAIAASGALAAVLEPTWALFRAAPSAAPATRVSKSPAARAAPAHLDPVRERAADILPAEELAAPAPPTRSQRRETSAETHPTAAPTNTEPNSVSAQELFAEANRARRAQELGRATSLYRTLQARYPGSAEAELSRVTLATLLLDRGEAAEALNGFERYLGGPSRALEVEAWVGRARALERLGRNSEALRAWEQVRDRFPQTIHARQAAERLSSAGKP